MPMNKKDYPENWKWISAQVRKDAGDRCELCYAPNGQVVGRPTKNQEKHWTHPWYLWGADSKFVKIVLTVHHIDSDKKNNSRVNLIALCQKCHLRLDLQKHIAKRRRAAGV